MHALRSPSHHDEPRAPARRRASFAGTLTRALVLAWWALAVVSCDRSSTPAPRTASIEIVHAAASSRQPHPAVTHFAVSGFDHAGALVFGPQRSERAPRVVVSAVPASVTFLEIEYQAADLVRHRFRTAVDLSTADVVSLQDPSFVDADDPTVLAFATFGCNRVKAGDISKGDPSSANLPQLQKSLGEIAALEPLPSTLFLTGDIVSNEVDGTATLTTQLGKWKEKVPPALSGGIPIVVMPGNHEMVIKPPGGAPDSEFPNPAAGAVFAEEMAAYIKGSNGPTEQAPNVDQLGRDESRLSYTYRDASGAQAFVVLNTDTYEGYGPSPAGSVYGKAPLDWLRLQLIALNADAAVKNIFVFGHRPAGDVGEEKGLVQEQARNLTSLLTQPGSKVRGYFCAHAHLWQDSLLGGSKVHQIIAGNGGSDTDSGFGNPYFGYTVVHLHASGSVSVQSWGWPKGASYRDPPPVAHSTRREHLTIWSP